jgi:secondary thiamine-phosphate synthase enzyme
MKWYKTTLSIQTRQKGLHDFTSSVNQQIRQWGVNEGMAFLFIQHTSASLVINENYDSSARRDLEVYLEHLAPEGESWYEHTLEGSDDSPAHMRTMITTSSLTIPIDNGKLSLGTWQGLYLAEHRRRGQRRNVLLRVLSVD